MSDRNQGNPNNRVDSRAGRDRTPADIPKQAHKSRFSSQASTVTHFTARASYTIGPAQRPSSIVHDNGFLILGKRHPTKEDYTKLIKWQAMLEGAEALRPDLVDGTAAYRHFLWGNGKQRSFSYERYAMNDASGKLTLRNAILDIQTGVIRLYKNNTKLTDFLLTGSPITCGGSPEFPYPATENWQKAIGGHTIWLSGHATVHGGQKNKPKFSVSLTLHAEDRYNFNPGQQDIVTGIPDSDNGRFEMTGLAHQYNQFATLSRVVVWHGFELGVISAAGSTYGRDRQPQENRRARNRI